jgi:hypothetical protein
MPQLPRKDAGTDVLLQHYREVTLVTVTVRAVFRRD